MYIGLRTERVFVLSNGLGGRDGVSVIGLVQRLILTRGCGPCGQQTSTLIKPNQVSGSANHFFLIPALPIPQLRNDRLTAES